MFGEKKSEYSNKKGAEIPVWQSPKYLESRKKAEEIIKDGRYGLSEADFWINMNETKSGKMAYTGLILSHNACLKINDKLEDKFRPECVSMDKDGYSGSLVFFYCCPEQGLYEVGECNPKNCKIDYPYAMALKRMQDRVVLKLSKLAYSGIYSEVEADEFAVHDETEAAPEVVPDAEKVPMIDKSARKELFALAGEVHGDNAKAVVKAVCDAHGWKTTSDIPAKDLEAVRKEISDYKAA